MEVNFFGVLNMTRAFAPVLAANGGGAMITVSSIAGLVNFPDLGSYSASKAAVHSMIQGTRAELAGQKTQVFGVYPGRLIQTWAPSWTWRRPRPRMLFAPCSTAWKQG